MINTWFIADTNFGHSKILEYQPVHRPFKTIEEHDEVIIERWNSVVKPNDKVFHLGGFCLGGAKNVKNYRQRLNGHKTLIMGKHDVYPLHWYLEIFKRVYGLLSYKHMILSHMPVLPDDRFKLNVHGYLHAERVEIVDYDDSCLDPYYFCVSAEQNNLTPIHLDIIRERLK